LYPPKWFGREKILMGKAGKKAGLHVSPKTIKRALDWRGIISVGLAKSHLSIGKLSTLEKYMQ
jgi:hypothetical protein